MISDYERIVYRISDLKPFEFWGMTPAELEPYIEAHIKREEDKIRMENERIGLICATIQNGVPVGFLKSGAKKHKATDYFKSPDASDAPDEKKDNLQQVFETMNAWCSATRGGGISG